MVPPIPVSVVHEPPRGRGRASGILRLIEQSQRELSVAVQAMSTCSPQNHRELPVGVQASTSSRVQEVRSGCDQPAPEVYQPVPEVFQDAESTYPAPMIPVHDVTTEDGQEMDCEQPEYDNSSEQPENDNSKEQIEYVSSDEQPECDMPN